MSEKPPLTTAAGATGPDNQTSITGGLRGLLLLT
jgi:hypothetical protein